MHANTEQLHPWARGRDRPPLMQFAPRRPRSPAKRGGAVVAGKPAPAARGAMPPAEVPTPAEAAVIDWHEIADVEFVNSTTLARAAVECEVRRRRDALVPVKLIGWGLGAVACVLLLVEAWHGLFNRVPAEGRLAVEMNAVAAQVLAQAGSPAQPFLVDSVRAELVSRDGSRRADYAVVVTLRLAENLYAPADSNGAKPYLLLQRSVAEARDRMLKHSLYINNPSLADPVRMPALLAIAHRAGEKRVVRVPMEAVRPGWRWRLQAHPHTAGGDGERMSGQVLSHYSDGPVLVFNSPQAREGMRPLMAEARKFVVAVNRELARRGLASGAGGND